MAVDTGASITVISRDVLQLAGHEPASAERRVTIATVSGLETVPVVRVGALTALGVTRRGIAVLAHTLPPAARVDGLLGLDFFRDRRLTLDFRLGEITLE